MTQNQITARIQAVFEFPDQFSLRFPVKINHHIAAENQIVLDRSLRLHQIFFFESESNCEDFDPPESSSLPLFCNTVLSTASVFAPAPQ